MTVEECGQAVFACVLTAIQEGPTNEGYAHAADEIRANLQALIYAESVRGAALVEEAREYNVRHRLGYKIADALRECRDEILRTSPGKVGG